MGKGIGIFVALIVFFGFGVGAHAVLVTTASSDSGWSDRAAASCAFCHGG